jgi:hypothetical protein
MTTVAPPSAEEALEPLRRLLDGEHARTLVDAFSVPEAALGDPASVATAAERTD